MRRRELLMGLGGAMGTMAVGNTMVRAATARQGSTGDKDRKLLFVLCGYGGASIVDSFLPVVRSEVDDDALADTLNVFADDEIVVPEGSNIRAPAYVASAGLLAGIYQASYYTSDFLAKHHREMTVLTQECTSVNHQVAQARSLNGNGINSGRTLMEAMALRHGEDLILPNCNMAVDGFIQPGWDPTIPSFARAEIISSPMGFAAAMDGMKGVLGVPDRKLVQHARGVRDRLDDASPFGRTFEASPLRRGFLDDRRERLPRLEAAQLVDPLTLLPPELLDPRYGVTSSPLLPALLARLPELHTNPWQAQAALSVLLTYYGLSCATTISLAQEPVFGDADKLATAPVAFDFSHVDHRVAQQLMWGAMLEVADALIALLKELDYLGDPSLGKMWDRSLVYIATDFGREKTRPVGAPFWGTAHALNNGTLLMSPLLQGNRVFGGIDPKTCTTYGFDGSSGEADPTLRCDEGHIYSAVAQALDIDFPARHDMSAVLA
ncbi:MAG: hypothetical protein IPK74_38090 [Deltaproteobacteria bacterium]|nr:hypothetical protein [Deltaproteobacteria bacterium]